MIKHYRMLSLGCTFILVMGLMLWPGSWPPRAFANVTLVSFTTISVPGVQEIWLEWETATEIDTAGFFISRGDSADGSFVRISDLIPSEGDSVTGAQYEYIDADTELNQAYYYKLEVLNNDQTLEKYGPIRAVAGVLSTEAPTDTPTPTASYTPTRTPTPTTTPTTFSNKESANPTAPANNVIVATPRLVTGATITPRPTAAGDSSKSVVSTVAAGSSPVGTDSQLPAPFATSVPSVIDAATGPAAVPPPPAQSRSAQDVVAQPPAPTLVPTDAIPAMVDPVVIATEAAPPAASTDTTTSGPFILIVAALLFLGLAFVILRQARQ